MATQNQRQAKPQVVIPEDIAIDGEDFLVRYGEVDQVLDDARGRIRVESRTPRVSILRFDEHSISTRDFCLSAAIARMGDAPRGRGIEYVLLSQAKIQGLRKQIIAAYEGGALELNNSVTMGPVQRINGRNFWKLVISSASLERWLEKCDRSLKIEIGTSQTSDAGLQEDREPSSSNRPVPKQRW